MPPSMPALDLPWYEPALYGQEHKQKAYADDPHNMTFFYASSTTGAVPVRPKALPESDVAHRINAIIDNLHITKSLAAKIIGVSRPTLYAWIKGDAQKVRVDNIKKIEWLEKLSDSLNDNIKRNTSLYQNRLLGPNKIRFEDMLIDADVEADQVAAWLESSIKKIKERPPLGDWRRNKTRGYISDISEAYSDNG